MAEARLERLRDAGAAKVQAADTARADERKAWAALTDAATTVRDDKKRARLQVEQLARSQTALQHCEATADRQHQLQQLAIKTKHRTDRACCRTTASRWTSSRRAHAPTTQPRNGACNSGGSGACCRPRGNSAWQLFGLDVGAASACLRRGDFRVGERAGETQKQRCAGVAAEVMCALCDYACPWWGGRWGEVARTMVGRTVGRL